MKLYMIQYKENNKWHWSKEWVYTSKLELEHEFLSWYNDPIGNSTMESIKNTYRIKSVNVTLPKIVS